jgi:tetratricopeptide (TPR) repeat protein
MQTDVWDVMITATFFLFTSLGLTLPNQSFYYNVNALEDDIEYGNMTALKESGDRFYDLEQYSEAIKYYDIILAINETDTYALSQKASSLFFSDKYNDALIYYDMALAINKTDIYSLTGKGDVLFLLGNYEDAIKYYDMTLAINKTDTYALASKGDALNNLGRYDEALKNQDMALAIDKNDTYALTSRGDTLVNLYRYDEAIDSYDKALEIDRNDTNLITSKATALYEMSRYDQAIDNYDKALAIDKNDSYALDGKAVSLYVLGRYGEAIKYYDEALIIDKNDTYALNGKGDSFYALENYKEALEQYDAVLDLEPGNDQANTSKQGILNKINEIRDSSDLEDSGFIQLLQDEWLTDPLSIYVKIDSSIDNPRDYLNISLRAIDTWSQSLKQKSANYVAWNFSVFNSVDNPNLEKITEPIDVVLHLTRSSLTDSCGPLVGITYPFPLDRTEPVYSKVFISCEDIFTEEYLYPEEVYSIVLHEFGHVLGLDHTFNMKGDLMCPNSYDESIDEDDEYDGCVWSKGENAPSDLDLDALIYKYGYDGFNSPNTKVKEESRFDFSFLYPPISN